jgi:hypothetical protein
VWDWGDGQADVHPDLPHAQDVDGIHAYTRPGDYVVRLIAEFDGEGTLVESPVHVVPARPSVGVFAALSNGVWVPPTEQQEIVALLQTSLAERTAEVRAFSLGEGAAMAAWMESLLADEGDHTDVIVLLDYIPAALTEGGVPGSLLQRWVEGGNGVLWSGNTPLLLALRDDGIGLQTPTAADELLESDAPFVVFGVGTQRPTALGTRIVPSLTQYRSGRALRYDSVGPRWRSIRVYAEDQDHDSDAIELLHESGGFYAQFLCDQEDGLARPQVLSEFLLNRGTTRARSLLKAR